jgi:trans-aconitate 2-methyltransferase
VSQAVINCISKALKPAGRLVVEFGDKGNIKAIMPALQDAYWN